MASSTDHFWILIFALIISTSGAQSSLQPKGILIPAIKESTTLQYHTQFYMGNPPIDLDLTIDLGGQFLWTDCEHYNSTTYLPARCNSAKCSLARSSICGMCYDGPPRPGCTNLTCYLIYDNTVVHTGTVGMLNSDYLELRNNPENVISVSHFLFVCGYNAFLRGLAPGVKGMAGFGRTRISLPSQFSASFSFPRKFSMCLSSSTQSHGAIFLGGTLTKFSPNVDISSSLIYTPLILNPTSTASAYVLGDASSDYFIGVKSIRINEKPVNINATLLKINHGGHGGTKISTVDPYTILETSIYKAIIDVFVKELSGIPRVPSVKPFSACFSSKNISSSTHVPDIHLVLQSTSVYWTISKENLMVQVNENVLCLGFVDGGLNLKTSIVIGGHQIEEKVLEFDLASSKMGFSPSLLSKNTSCASFSLDYKSPN